MKTPHTRHIILRNWQSADQRYRREKQVSLLCGIYVSCISLNLNAQAVKCVVM